MTTQDATKAEVVVRRRPRWRMRLAVIASVLAVILVLAYDQVGQGARPTRT
jgi:hypothetical protein